MCPLATSPRRREPGKKSRIFFGGGRMWTTERIERLTELWASGMSTALVGKEFGLSKSAIAGKIRRLGLPSRAVRIEFPHPRDWTQDRVDRLLQMHRERRSARYMAADLGITKFAVNSKLFRLGVDRWTGRRRATMARTGPTLKASPVAEGPRPEHFLGVTFENLTDDQCRYPRGDNPFLFCGQPKMQESSYCAKCHALCWVRPFTQMRAA